MTTYEVIVGGIQVWTAATATYEGIEVFPPEYLNRPAAGSVHLVIDSVIIGVQVPLADEV